MVFWPTVKWLIPFFFNQTCRRDKLTRFFANQRSPISVLTILITMSLTVFVTDLSVYDFFDG